MLALFGWDVVRCSRRLAAFDGGGLGRVGQWTSRQLGRGDRGASLGMREWSVGAANWRGNARLGFREVVYRDAIRRAIMKREDEV